MAMAGSIGTAITLPQGDLPLHGLLFGEDQARYVLTTAAPDTLLAAAKAQGVPATRLGTTGGAALTVHGAGAISISELRRVNEAWLPDYMAAP
jgi:phosphoribosylformylglycinamidine synthase subunit PurL